MFWLTIAAIVMTYLAFQLGVVSVQAAVFWLVIKSIMASFVLVAGFFGWRCYRNRKPKQLPGGTYEQDR